MERRARQRARGSAPRNSRRTLLLSLAKPEFKYLPDVWRVYHFVNLRFTVVLLSRSLSSAPDGGDGGPRRVISLAFRLSFPQLGAIYV